MNRAIQLTKRNLRLFLRDRATVFFSFLSTLILVALYFLFIAKTYTDAMDTLPGELLGASLDAGAKNFLVYLQMMAGVLVLNSMSLATGAFSTVAKDFESGRIDSLLLSPVSVFDLIFSYFAAGLCASFGINSFTWAVSYAIIGIATGYWLAAGAFLTVLAVLLVASLVSCSLMILVTALVKSSTAIGVVNGVSGTFFGFLCGIYMPYSNLGEGTKTIGSFLPFSHLTIWLKQVVLDSAFGQIGLADAAREILSRGFFSAESIGLGALDAPLGLMVALSAAAGLACLIAACAVLRRRIRR